MVRNLIMGMTRGISMCMVRNRVMGMTTVGTMCMSTSTTNTKTMVMGATSITKCT